jgi:serine phosphatase RsbU (regulator of sigma subunit)
MEDIKQARSIQLHAMETHQDRDPRIQIAVHNIPYEYVSGDFYRVEKISPDSYAIFIADIMGHGVSSALYAMTIRTVWEEARHLLSNPSAFCSHLNEQLFNMTKLDDSFATAIFGVIDLEAMEFRFVRAGHPPPLLSRAGTVTECGSSNQALGFFENGVFASDTINLQPGDKILAFTDGAVEIMDSDGDELGIEGLGSMMSEEESKLSGIELINKIEQRLLDYSKDMVFSDDVTIAEIEILQPE